MLAMRYLNCNMVADETKVTTRFRLERWLWKCSRCSHDEKQHKYD